MASKTKGGLLLVAVVVGGLALGGQAAIDTVTGWFDGGGTELIGEGDTQLMVASSAESKVKQCPTAQIVKDRRCGDLKVLLVDARRMPFIARNTKEAWESGLPAVLTMNRPKQPANREIACGKFVHKYPPPVGSCDEYPMASTDEGGKGARAVEVPGRENLCQGGSYRAQYPKDGEQLVMVIIYPGLIASSPFAGVDIAKEKGFC